MNFEIKKKACKLISDLIDSALCEGWELSENDEESKFLGTEIKSIETELRKISFFTENQYKLYLELKEVKERQREMKEAMKCTL